MKIKRRGTVGFAGTRGDYVFSSKPQLSHENLLLSVGSRSRGFVDSTVLQLTVSSSATASPFRSHDEHGLVRGEREAELLEARGAMILE